MSEVLGIEFVSRDGPGRRFDAVTSVRLGDAGPDGRLRPDGLARFLQDVATDDWRATGIDTDETWVVRRTAIRVRGEWPRYLEDVTLSTWCGGLGAAWAERRTDVIVNGEVRIEAVAIWVPIDASGRPLRLRSPFVEVYGESAQGRKVSGRVTLREPAASSPRREWPLRESDFDVVGHVNNAALWQAVSEIVPTPRTITVIHHGSIERGDHVTLVTEPLRCWLCVGGEVRVSVEYEG